MELAAPVKIGETRSLGLGRDLEEEVRRVTELLCDMPQLGQPVDSRHRKFPLNRFRSVSYFESMANCSALLQLRIGASVPATGPRERDLQQSVGADRDR